MRGLRLLAITCVTLAGLAGSAAAHVTLEQGEAAANSTYKAILRVGHGCEGAATNVVRVQIPEGLICSFPCTTAGGAYQIVPDLKVNDFSRGKIDASVGELVEERKAVRALGLID